MTSTADFIFLLSLTFEFSDRQKRRLLFVRCNEGLGFFDICRHFRMIFKPAVLNHGWVVLRCKLHFTCSFLACNIRNESEHEISSR